MLDTDTLILLRAESNFKGPRNQKELQNQTRQYNKILLEATNQSTNYTTQRTRIGSSFESLFRSVGLGLGILVGGPVGSATLGSIAGGIGRGAGEYLGNKIYGKAIYDLEQIQTNHKYKQLITNFALSNKRGEIALIDQFYTQVNQSKEQLINELGQNP
ncbi:MAG: hypothetical protein QNJ31_03395 [Candidatus Caenarcaniphilales bacterium]|nr:hypothetical protein [Candidatus Caenarcaniphilales bacterium]